MENIMKMICNILVRVALCFSLVWTGFLFDFLFAIAHLLNTHVLVNGSCH